MVERISKCENQMGIYARPGLREPVKAEEEDKKADMIDALLANEALRKKERIVKEKQEADLLKKRKELKSMSVDELKKRCAKKHLETSGKREDMIEALFIAVVQEDAAVARKSELQSKSTEELKALLVLNGLETGSKDVMVKTLLAHEAKCREELKIFEAKVAELATQKKTQLETVPLAKLKTLCTDKGLPVGGDKEEKVDRILEESLKNLEFDKAVSMNIRNKRKDELMSMDKPAVLKLCEEEGVDPLVKDIIIERIMTHESEAGPAIAADDAEPASKRSRKK